MQSITCDLIVFMKYKAKKGQHLSARLAAEGQLCVYMGQARWEVNELQVGYQSTTTLCALLSYYQIISRL